jgi:hypothetical protein
MWTFPSDNGLEGWQGKSAVQKWLNSYKLTLLIEYKLQM